MRKTLDGPVGDEILKSCEDQGLVGLAFYDSGARSIYGKKPVRNLADAKGMKIRVQQSDLWVALLNAMGANATPMPIAEVYTALKTGLIDAAENNIPSYDGFKHFEAVKFYSRTEHSMAPEMLMMSKAVFDKLSKADQDLIRQAAKESVAFERKKWDEQEAKSLAVVKAAGAEIVDNVDKASFQQAMTPVYDKFITTPDLKRLVKAVQDTK
jgi:tripartite ATP-independent transporter DctP family solute receptor